MTDLADTEQLREQAKQAVDRFVRRFDESYRLLAYHAALPLVLTPELVNYLRNEFLRGEQVPWVAEVDLLLSDLCSQVGYELYAMETHVREYLLKEMQQDSRFGKRRMQEVAQVLYSYVNYLSRLNPGRRKQEIEAQRWAAMVYLGDEQCKKAAREITERLIETASLSESGIRVELARLTRITEELSPQLEQGSTLLAHARTVQRFLRTPELVSVAELRSSYWVDDLELRFPERLLPADLARTLTASRQILPNLEGFPAIQTFAFKVTTITVEGEDGEIEPFTFNLQPFEFEVATIEPKQSDLFRQKTELIVKRTRQQAQHFIENLGNEIALEMVQIPGGTFVMGALKKEEDSTDDECPQHQVTISPFYMGKYPVTQAQWQAVAALEQVNQELDSDPSNFKGKNLPVEQVSWDDAKEFCDRLSRQTGKPYRLPSEAEWEYACRAGTTTPFHFGETITSQLANYNGEATYGVGTKGTYPAKTTPVGSFEVANAFGLYDMYGNVWEWCADHWHNNYKYEYEKAPADGSVWIDSGNDNLTRLLRGGSWYNVPGHCRSAHRYKDKRDHHNYGIGFRVVCAGAVARTL